MAGVSQQFVTSQGIPVPTGRKEEILPFVKGSPTGQKVQASSFLNKAGAAEIDSARCGIAGGIDLR